MIPALELHSLVHQLNLLGQGWERQLSQAGFLCHLNILVMHSVDSNRSIELNSSTVRPCAYRFASDDAYETDGKRNETDDRLIS